MCNLNKQGSIWDGCHNFGTTTNAWEVMEKHTRPHGSINIQLFNHTTTTTTTTTGTIPLIASRNNSSSDSTTPKKENQALSQTLHSLPQYFLHKLIKELDVVDTFPSSGQSHPLTFQNHVQVFDMEILMHLAIFLPSLFIDESYIDVFLAPYFYL